MIKNLKNLSLVNLAPLLFTGPLLVRLLPSYLHSAGLVLCALVAAVFLVQVCRIRGQADSVKQNRNETM